MKYSTVPYAATRSTVILTIVSVLGPLSGLIMEMVLAWRYGTTGTIDAFRIASLLLVIGNQLFLGHLLPHIIVPLFSEYRSRGSEDEGLQLAFSMAIILSLLSLILISWVWLDPGELIELLGPGLITSTHEDASLLIRYFSLVLLMMVWSGMASGILYVYRVFWLSPVAQLLPNLCVILTVLIIGKEFRIGSLALGMILGYIAMLALFSHVLIHINGISSITQPSYLKLGPHKGLLKALHLFIPLIIMIIIGQWSMIIINRVLSEMPPGTLAEFGYAWKLLALIGLLPASLATVIFPAFSAAHAENNPAEFSRLATRAFRTTLLLTLPLATVLFVERIPIVNLIFGRGGMDTEAVFETAQLFGILLISAPAGALSVALGKIAFSMQDTRSPTIVALISALAITGIMPYVAEVGGATGVAYAFSAIAWCSTLLMLSYQIIRYRIISAWKAIIHFSCLITLGVGVALSTMIIRFLFEINAPTTSTSALLEIVLSGLVFIIVGYSLSRILRIHEATEIWNYIKWQLQELHILNKTS